MKRQLAATTIALVLATTTGVLSTPLVTGDTAWARAGGGSSGGSRGSRGFSTPSSSPTSPSRSTAPATPPTSPAAPTSPTPQRSGWGAGLMGGIGGLVVGGLIGSMLFGGMGHGLGGGVGLLEIALLGGLAYFAFSLLRRRREPAVAGGYGVSSVPGGEQSWSPDRSAPSVATLEPPAGPTDLRVGVGHIQQMDATFDPARMGAAASDVFFKVQAAWMARDMGAARDSLTSEMYDRMQGQCAELRAQRRINRLENIAVRSTEVTEAWQEQGQDFVTVAFVASVLDYSTDESGTVVDGSRTEPVRFEEYWTFVRPVGPNAWRLSAIQQP